jgi:hypothetical protein
MTTTNQANENPTGKTPHPATKSDKGCLPDALMLSADEVSGAPSTKPVKRKKAKPKATPPNADHEAWKYIMFMYSQLDPESEFVCVTRNLPSGGWINCAPGNKVFVDWTNSDADEAWYITVATIDGEPNAKETMAGRGEDNLVRYHTLMLDDIGCADNSKATEPPVQPAAKIETSDDNFQWHYRVEPGDDFATYSAVVDLLTENGFGDPGATGSYRVVRLPRSANLKPGRDGFRSKVEYVDTENVWDLLELAEALGLDRSEIAARAATGKTKKGSPSSSTTTSGETIDPVLDWLNTAGHVRADADSAGWASIQCPWHGQHTTGEDTASYNPLGMGGDYASNRGFNCFHAHCKDRDATGFLDWVEAQGGPKASKYDPIPALQQDHVFVESDKAVIRLPSRRAGLPCSIRWDNFAKSHCHPAGGSSNKTVANAFIADFNTTKAARSVQFPTMDDQLFIEDADGQRSINLYVPPQWPETDDLPELLIKHFDYLIPVESERRLFWAWLAHKIQNPARRSYAMLLMTDGTQGVGRSVVARYLKKMLLGRVAPVSFEVLIGKGSQGEKNYNDWGVGKQFLYVEEAADVGREVFYKGYEHFKTYVDNAPSTETVNEKFGNKGPQTLYFNLLMFTNHIDALHLPGDDRRVTVLTNPNEKRSLAEYARLHDEVDDPNGQEHIRLYWYLRRMNIDAMLDGTGFDLVHAPMTPAKRRMLEATMSEQDETEQHLLNTSQYDFVTKATLKSAIIKAACDVDASRTISAPGKLLSRLWGRLQDAPWVKDHNGFRPRIGEDGKQVRVKALRDVEWPSKDADWSALTGEGTFGVSKFPSIR